MSRIRRSTAAGALAVAALAGSLAAPTAGATPATSPQDAKPVTTDSRTVTTIDGQELKVEQLNEQWTPVDNLASSPLTTEAFLDISARGTIVKGNPSDFSAAELDTGYMLGCEADFSQGFDLSDTLTLGGGVTIGSSIGGSVNISNAATLKFHVGPGKVYHFSLGKAGFGKAGTSNVTALGAHVHIDGCGGRVKVRSYATVRAVGESQNSIVTIYGKDQQL